MAPELINSYMHVAAKHNASASIRLRSESWLLRVVSPVVRIFNPKFDTYITTLGTTIYVPDGFLDRHLPRVLETIGHETRHVMDYRANPVLFVLGYGAPQILALPLVVLLLCLGCGWWSLFGLVLLAPIPAPWRYKDELRAYRVSILLGRHVFGFSEQELSNTREWVVAQLATRWYYWTWPFPGLIRKDLQDESFAQEEFYTSIVAFFKQNNITF